jgi:hypothetical protein
VDNDKNGGNDDTGAAFPPHGWLTKQQVARMLGISRETLCNPAWQRRLVGAKAVMRPDAGRCKIYPVAQVEQIRQERAAKQAAQAAKEAARAAAAAGPPAPPAQIPQGFVDRAGACRILRVSWRQLKHWVTDGKLQCGVSIPSRVGGRCSIYPVEALRKLREEMLGRENLYKCAAGTFEVPQGWARRHEACRVFGVDKATWQQWREQGLLPCGQRFDGGPTVYRIEELKKMLEGLGRLRPPYRIDPSDPSAPIAVAAAADANADGAYRVPLCGEETGREAIIDADSLALLDGAVLAWAGGERGVMPFVSLRRADKPGGMALRRLIMNVTADDDDLQVGHVNGDPLDCRRVNLFARTIAQRSYGTRKMRSVKGRPCTSRFKGVSFESQTKKWKAAIVLDGKTRRLGRFNNEIAAAQAYDEAARELFGEYAYLNFPDGVDARLEAEAIRAERAEAA